MRGWGISSFWGDYVMVTRCIPALRPCAHLTSYIRTLYTVVHSDRKCFFKVLVKYLLSIDNCFALFTNFLRKSNIQQSLRAVHKLCLLKGGGGGGQKLLILLSKKTTRRRTGRGSKIANVETA